MSDTIIAASSDDDDDCNRYGANSSDSDRRAMIDDAVAPGPLGAKCHIAATSIILAASRRHLATHGTLDLRLDYTQHGPPLGDGDPWHRGSSSDSDLTACRLVAAKTKANARSNYQRAPKPTPLCYMSSIFSSSCASSRLPSSTNAGPSSSSSSREADDSTMSATTPDHASCHTSSRCIVKDFDAVNLVAPRDAAAASVLPSPSQPRQTPALHHSLLFASPADRAAASLVDEVTARRATRERDEMLSGSRECSSFRSLRLLFQDEGGGEEEASDGSPRCVRRLETTGSEGVPVSSSSGVSAVLAEACRRSESMRRHSSLAALVSPAGRLSSSAARISELQGSVPSLLEVTRAVAERKLEAAEEQAARFSSQGTELLLDPSALRRLRFIETPAPTPARQSFGPPDRKADTLISHDSAEDPKEEKASCISPFSSAFACSPASSRRGAGTSRAAKRSSAAASVEVPSTTMLFLSETSSSEVDHSPTMDDAAALSPTDPRPELAGSSCGIPVGEEDCTALPSWLGSPIADIEASVSFLLSQQ
jgi:hypothetical protein